MQQAQKIYSMTRDFLIKLEASVLPLFSIILLTFISGCTTSNNNISHQLPEEPITDSSDINKLKAFSVYSNNEINKELANLASDDNSDNSTSQSLLWESIIEDMELSTKHKQLTKSSGYKKIFSYRKYFAKQLNSGNLFLYYITNELKTRNMPVELALLPIIESNYNPHAKSPYNAMGIWQFIPQTARHFNLKHDANYDMRLDVIASTEAALNYLNKLHDMFGDWELALAAYNVGPYAVKKAVDYNKKHKLPTDLWSLKISNSGKIYVEKLYTYAELVKNHKKYHIVLPKTPNQPVFKIVPLKNQSLNQVAAQTDVSIATLRKLNPGFSNINKTTQYVQYLLIPTNLDNENLVTASKNY